ncbi:MAG: YhbY family RNA-binding protein [Bacilli bacterium]|jgi:RNA-binding protein
MLNIKQKSALRKIAVQNKVLKFTIGKGSIDSNVLSMLDNTITKHELIKIAFLKSAIKDDNLEQMILDISSGIHCDIVQTIGNTALLYRPNPKLPNGIKI